MHLDISVLRNVRLDLGNRPAVERDLGVREQENPPRNLV